MSTRWAALTILAMTAIFHSNLPAATYYVNPTGDDTKDGTTQATAWKTVAKVNATKLEPGDQILFARGGEWRESLVPATDGAADKPIVFADYGDGAKPRFWGSEIMPNADFLPVDGSTYKYVFKHDVDRHMGVAVNHDLLAWSVMYGEGKHEADLIAEVERTPLGYWIDDGSDTAKGNSILYINTGGSDPRTDGKLYTLCSRQDVVQNNYKSHLIFRNLIADETARLEGGFAFHIAGGADIRLENCEAYRVGIAHFNITNCDGIVCDHLKAAYGIPRQHGHDISAFWINNDGAASAQLIDCVAEHMENFPGWGNFLAFSCIGSSTGNVLIKNLTCTANGGGGFIIGTNATVKMVGGNLADAHGVIYSAKVLLDGVTFTGNSAMDIFGSDNILQNCKFVNILPEHGGPTGYACAVICRDKARNNTIRFCTITLAPGVPENGSCLTLGGKGTLTQWYGNIFVGRPLFFSFAGNPDAGDAAMVDYNLYPTTVSFGDANLSLAAWQAANFDPHSLTGDPMFTDLPHDDVSLKTGSPAIGAAKIDPAQRPATDFAGNPRPGGDACSIGALEPEETLKVVATQPAK